MRRSQSVGRPYLKFLNLIKAFVYSSTANIAIGVDAAVVSNSYPGYSMSCDGISCDFSRLINKPSSSSLANSRLVC
ncbi:hypothetical protein BX666DRAFT_2163365 [Dichotomocladium elegans]|nr:hypothetical protein BX666DRAFT_2163365 [Dichotomocladium elegans]